MKNLYINLIFLEYIIYHNIIKYQKNKNMARFSYTWQIYIF